MHQTMDANGITGDGYIRLVATRGVGSLGLSIKHTACPTVIVIADKIALYPAETYERGLHCVISSLARNHPNTTSPRVKSLNYLNNIMAKAEAQEAGCDEAIMLTLDGHVSECTGDNIFLVRHGEVFTPPTSEGILEGLTRNLVMELARKRGLKVTEKALIRHDLFVCEECFATGTAAEVIAITKIARALGRGRAAGSNHASTQRRFRRISENKVVHGSLRRVATDCRLAREAFRGRSAPFFRTWSIARSELRFITDVASRRGRCTVGFDPGGWHEQLAYSDLHGGEFPGRAVIPHGSRPRGRDGGEETGGVVATNEEVPRAADGGPRGRTADCGLRGG